jgi:hypothetical protein
MLAAFDFYGSLLDQVGTSREIGDQCPRSPKTGFADGA